VFTTTEGTFSADDLDGWRAWREQRGLPFAG
jgi:hypothetical protein